MGQIIFIWIYGATDSTYVVGVYLLGDGDFHPTMASGIKYGISKINVQYVYKYKRVYKKHKTWFN